MAKRGKAKVRYGVQCNTHGAENKLWAGRMVLVSKPQNKRQKMGGCPLCSAEARREQAQDAQRKANRGPTAMSQPVRNADELPAVGTPVERPVGRPVSERVTLVCVLEQQRYRPGDQAPEGYLAWHEWAEVQHKAGLRQKQCGRCGLWRYPQQLSALVDSTEVTGLRKRQPFLRTLETPVCNDCAEKPK